MRFRIGLDARFALGERRGIGNYSLELFKAMAHLNQAYDFVFYSDREDSNGVLSRLPNCQIRVLRPGLYPLWEQVLLPLALWEDGIDLLHSVGNTAPIFLPKRTKLVITLCDVMYMKDEGVIPLSSSWYQRAGRIYRRLIVPPASRKADYLLTISEFSRTDICETLPGIQAAKIGVALLGLPGSFTAYSSGEVAEAPFPTPYLLHLGGLDQRKNTRLVVQSFLDLKRKGLINEVLVILGLKTIVSLDLEPREVEEAHAWIHVPGFVPAAELPNYYRHASAFLFPSLYEGFGIPLLEAMASGTPIITSSRSSLPEVAGDAAILIDPSKPEDLKEAILQLLGSPLLQEQLRSAGLNRLAVFQWPQTASQTLACYQMVLDGQQSSSFSPPVRC